MNKKLNTELVNIISGWIKQQKKVAHIIGISPAALNKMLKNEAALPLSRFLQLVYYCKPPQNEIDKAFQLYLQELNISPDFFVLTINSNSCYIRSKIHSMIDRMTEDQLQKLEPLLAMLLEK